ncbi:DUF3911 family protein [Ectobacillus panaciterrae]|uniref:DUF3911 family protein n=1 Tax=Ectobacillus panaciterrae TaxID=363872 RepID=UPI00041B1916|nr:DUF3911 family protein [Ectobacillus panaciterrae]
MASLQIKGTRQEVMEMLELFNFMNTQGLCKLDDDAKLSPYAQEEEWKSVFVASIGVRSRETEMDDVLNDQFMSQMLTGVYND